MQVSVTLEVNEPSNHLYTKDSGIEHNAVQEMPNADSIVEEESSRDGAISQTKIDTTYTTATTRLSHATPESFNESDVRSPIDENQEPIEGKKLLP